MENNKKELPILFENENECCGCTACYAVCPQKAIKMEEDKEGFLYPNVDDSLCVKCFLCMKVCPFK